MWKLYGTLNQRKKVAEYFARINITLSRSAFISTRIFSNKYIHGCSVTDEASSILALRVHATFSSENDIKQILLRRNIVLRYPTRILLFSTRWNCIIQVAVCWNSATPLLKLSEIVVSLFAYLVDVVFSLSELFITRFRIHTHTYTWIMLKSKEKQATGWILLVLTASLIPTSSRILFIHIPLQRERAISLVKEYNVASARTGQLRASPWIFDTATLRARQTRDLTLGTLERTEELRDPLMRFHQAILSGANEIEEQEKEVEEEKAKMKKRKGETSEECNGFFLPLSFSCCCAFTSNPYGTVEEDVSISSREIKPPTARSLKRRWRGRPTSRIHGIVSEKENPALIRREKWAWNWTNERTARE